MKKNTHPQYQDVLFVDTATGFKFVCASAQKSEAKAMHEGQEYPVVHLSVSSYSHPYFTGDNKLIDTEGRIDKFNRRYGPKQ